MNKIWKAAAKRNRRLFHQAAEQVEGALEDYNEARQAIYGASFILAQAHQEGQPPLDCRRLREVCLRAHNLLRKARGLGSVGKEPPP